MWCIAYCDKAAIVTASTQGKCRKGNTSKLIIYPLRLALWQLLIIGFMNLVGTNFSAFEKQFL